MGDNLVAFACMKDPCIHAAPLQFTLILPSSLRFADVWEDSMNDSQSIHGLVMAIPPCLAWIVPLVPRI